MNSVMKRLAMFPEFLLPPVLLVALAGAAARNPGAGGTQKEKRPDRLGSRRFLQYLASRRGLEPLLPP